MVCSFIDEGAGKQGYACGHHASMDQQKEDSSDGTDQAGKPASPIPHSWPHQSEEFCPHGMWVWAEPGQAGNSSAVLPTWAQGPVKIHQNKIN